MAKKKAPGDRPVAFVMAQALTDVTYASCTVLSSRATTCPLCRAYVAPGELHECTRSTGD